MIPMKITKTDLDIDDNEEKNFGNINNCFNPYKLILIISLFCIIAIISIIRNKIEEELTNNFGKADLNSDNKNSVTIVNSSFEKCYLSPDNSGLKIIHLILTRFMIEFWNVNYFKKLIYKESYIQNGMRVIKKYLLPSLENQSCKKFIWILMLGEQANITYIQSLLDFNTSFEKKIVYHNSIKSYVKNITKGFDVLISTRIDYDDGIYYDAINDVRKVINNNRPILLHGYNRGLQYYEDDNKYYYLWWKGFDNQSPMMVFASLIIMLNMVNDTYIIYDLGDNPFFKKKLLTSYKSFGIKELNYEPTIYDNGEPKFVWVRQKYSGTYHFNGIEKNRLRKCNYNLTLFYGK